MNKNVYVPPVADIVRLEGRDRILELSNFGDPGEPGTGFGDGDIIDIPILF